MRQKCNKAAQLRGLVVKNLDHLRAPRKEPIGGARSGLASRGATPQYSPALRWVTTGFGMGPGGATALWATSPPDWLRVLRADATAWTIGEGGVVVLPGGNKARLRKGPILEMGTENRPRP